MKKKNNVVQLMTEIALLSALGFVLDEFSGLFFKGIFFKGGSIGIAMCAVLIMAYRRGAIPAILTGLIIGLLDIMTGAYIVHPFQVFLDYIFPYALVGFAGIFKFYYDKVEARGKKILFIILGTFLGGLLKLASHMLSGMIFFVTVPTDLWKMELLSPFVYSLLYNGAYILPCIVLSGAVMVILQINAPTVLKAESLIENETIDDRNAFAYISTISLTIAGAFIFIYFLIKYILSYGQESYSGAWEYYFDPDSMVIFITGLFIMLGSINALIRIKKQIHSNSFYMGVVSVLFLTNVIYAVVRLVKAIRKENDPTNYIIWLSAGVILLGLSIFACIYTYKKRNIKAIENI